MQLHVFFTPRLIIPGAAPANDSYIVIDVIRATTTMTVMLDRGAARVLVAEDIEQARAAARLVPGRLLCGERNVRRIPGFDHGNSPVEFSRLDLVGREMIHTTTNGTRAFHACPESATRMAGCFYNAHAVAARALELAEARGGNIAIVCSGEFDTFALDDSVCAGYLALEIQRLATRQALPLDCHESVSAAITLYEAYQPPLVIEHCASAQTVIDAGLYEDPPFCMQTDVSTTVPTVIGREEETGLLVVERAI